MERQVGEGGEAASERIARATEALRRAKRALKAAQGDLEKHGAWKRLRHEADLLSSCLHTIKHRADSVTVTDYLPDGTEASVVIALDPMLSPSANLTARYELSSKGERGERMAARRVEDLSKRVTEAEEELVAAHAAYAEGIESGEIVEGVAKVGHGSPHRGKKSGGAKPSGSLDKASDSSRSTGGAHTPFVKEPSAPAPYRGFEKLEKNLRPRVCYAEDGTPILVGRSSAGNDMLTMRLANGNDWFFHVAGTPGSHVILRWGQKGTQPPAETMEAAAILALHFSKMKDASRAAVTYCQRKYVQKPKGAAPGMVYVSKGKTLAVRRDPAKLARLLGKELDGDA